MKRIDRLWGHIWLIVIAVLLPGPAFGAGIGTNVTGVEGIPLDKLEALSAIARNIGLIIIAVPALWLAWNRTRTASRQAQISESGLIIDRFQKGAQMLESEKLDVRFAGIYALRDLALSNPDETYITVQTLLCDFVRERSKQREPDFSMVTKFKPNPEYGQLPRDHHSAITTLNSLRQKIAYADTLEDAADWKMNLALANLFGAMFSDADLRKALFLLSNLSKAYLREADLSEANLAQANLDGADLLAANLSKAFLYEANLYGANLSFANLSEADLAGANLSGTILTNANLSDANISKAWVYDGIPPQGMEVQPFGTLATRMYDESWSRFVGRIMRERPELGWTENMKSSFPF
ncbi:MAG: pentapeptide repeat-containing protein [Roseibium sp.]